MYKYRVAHNGLCWDKSQIDLPIEEDVRLCEEWILTFTQTAGQKNRMATSHVLRHVVETWSGKHVSEGAVIQAALNCGYKIYPETDNPTCLFNMNLPMRRTARHDLAGFQHNSYCARQSEVA